MFNPAANIIDAMDAFGSDAWQNDFDQKLQRAKEQAPIPLPELISFADLCKTELLKPKPIIYSLFDQGSSMVIGGGSKTFKSWAMSDLAISISHGVDWWKFEVEQGSAIYCNFELKPYRCRERLLAICKAKEVVYPEKLFVWNLRGIKVKLYEFRQRLLEDISRYEISCVFVDPFYKLLGDKDERISSDLLPILEVFEEINCKTDAAMVCAAHFSKGNQAAKDPLDRISGGAALNRHPDCLLTLTKHEEDEAFAIDIINRDYPPIDPFVVTWAHPLFTPDASLDPAKLKVPKTGRSKIYDADQILEFLRSHDDEFNTTELQQALADETGMSRTLFYNFWAQLKAARSVFLSKMSGKWNLKVQK